MQPASATAELTRGNDLILYFTSTGIEDWYEVASSLCRFILNKQRVTDALLLTSLLSTPLRVLQRRGYDTSRVLNSRKAAHQKKLEQQREEGLKAELSKPAGPTADQLDQWTAQLLAEFPDANPDLVKRLLQAQSSNHYDSVHAQLEKGYKKATQSPMPEITTDRQTKASESLSSNGDARSTLSTANSESRLQRPNSSREKSSLLNGFRKKFLGDNASGSSYSSSGGNIPSIGQQAVTPGTSAMPRPTSKTTGTSTQPGETATPYSNISANVQQAISAARPDQRDTVQSQESKRYVHESENGYCDSNPVSAPFSFLWIP